MHMVMWEMQWVIGILHFDMISRVYKEVTDNKGRNIFYGNKWVFVGLVFTNYGNKSFMLEIEYFNDKYSVSNAKVL